MELSLPLGPNAASQNLSRLQNPNALFGIVQGGMFDQPAR